MSERKGWVSMLYGILAGIVIVLHLLWIIFLLTGARWGRKFFPVKVVHLAGLGFAVVSQVFGWFCPLTHLEVRLKELQGQTAYPGSFIAHYAEKLVYMSVPPLAVFILTLALVLMNVSIYAGASKKRRPDSF